MTTTGLSPLAAPIATGCCLATAAVYLAVDDPGDGGLHLPCPFRTITGFWCPACGMTRATHHLLRGDLVGALRLNVFVLAVVALIVAGWVSWTLGAARRRTLAVRLSPRAQIVAGAVLVAFAVVRNLPGVDGLRG